MMSTIMEVSGVVLSLFPGLGILDHAFEDEGFTIVRGPDSLWGGDIRRFHVPVGLFRGVIGGPPCQIFSKVRHFNPNAGKSTGNLIPEFERVVREARPEWFVMENIRDAPLPVAEGYQVDGRLFNNRWLGESQDRLHMFSFGTRDGRRLIWEEVIPHSPIKEPRLCASDGRRSEKRDDRFHYGRSVSKALELQGLPANYLKDVPLTKTGAVACLGNAVPYPLGRALARAVKRALNIPVEEE